MSRNHLGRIYTQSFVVPAHNRLCSKGETTVGTAGFSVLRTCGTPSLRSAFCGTLAATTRETTAAGHFNLWNKTKNAKQSIPLSNSPAFLDKQQITFSNDPVIDLKLLPADLETLYPNLLNSIISVLSIGPTVCQTSNYAHFPGYIATANMYQCAPYFTTVVIQRQFVSRTTIAHESQWPRSRFTSTIDRRKAYTII